MNSTYKCKQISSYSSSCPRCPHNSVRQVKHSRCNNACWNMHTETALQEKKNSGSKTQCVRTHAKAMQKPACVRAWVRACVPRVCPTTTVRHVKLLGSRHHLLLPPCSIWVSSSPPLRVRAPACIRQRSGVAVLQCNRPSGRVQHSLPFACCFTGVWCRCRRMFKTVCALSKEKGAHQR